AYTSVYTDFESGRVFWGADEELLDGGNDTNDEDEDEEEEEEEHLALVDFAIVIPTDSHAPAALPSPPLPPPLHMSPPIDRRDDIPNIEMPPHKKLCLSTLGSSTLDAEARRQGIRDVGYEDMIAHQETIQIVEDEAYVVREAWAHSIGLSQAVYSELQTHQQQMQQTKITELRETDRRRQAQMAETLRVMGDIRQEMGDMQAKLLSLRGQPRRAGQPGGDARVPNQQDAHRDADSHI
nr:hypothetical protein [Tanacetum cinerariifolium]